jgi:hypothetical protein
LGTVAQLKATEEPFLPSSTANCDCNATSTLFYFEENNYDESFFSIFYKISYIYYSMIGTLLTIAFGLIISHITDKHSERQILKIITDDADEIGFQPSGHFSVGSFLSLATQQRLSSFIRNVSHTTLKVENKLKEVISHSNLHHLHHLHVADDEERISILNEEDDQNDGNVHKDTGRRKMFFIGHQDEREHDE